MAGVIPPQADRSSIWRAKLLVALRYALADPSLMDAEYLLGWTEIDAEAEPVSDSLSPEAKVAHVDRWLDSRRSLIATISSAVLPEANIVLMNPSHPDARHIKPLTVRPFRFSECLHRPPMLDIYCSGGGSVTP